MSSRQSIFRIVDVPLDEPAAPVSQTEYGNPLAEPDLKPADSEPARRAGGNYDFLLGAYGGEPLLTVETVRAEARRARNLGLSLHRVLISEGHTIASDYVAALARSMGLPMFADPAAAGLRTGNDPRDLQQAMAVGTIAGRECVVLDGTLMAPQRTGSLARRYTDQGIAVALTTPKAMRVCALATAGPAILRHAVSGLAQQEPDASARAGSWLWQALTLASLAGMSLGLVVIGGLSAQWLMALLGTLPLLLTVGLRSIALLLHTLPPSPSSCRNRAAEDRALPVYTLLVPLFREAAVLPALVESLLELDYPRAKLDIKLILESVDAETIEAARRLNLPPVFDIIIVPERQPRTKPKALNYALTFARGDYVCVYDAEDRPEPGQLREAWRMFESDLDDLGCVQGRLAIDNDHNGWLTRQFSLEYLMLFDGLLPAFERLDVPMPLGGTSNHFPIRTLRRLGGWDAYNVTEDADLGMRLAHHGYRSRMLASRTFEEAPVTFAAWLPQRTRWLKGWMQTYIVHSRRPMRSLQALGPFRWLAMHAHFAGIILSCLLYPFSVCLVALQLLAAQSSEPGDGWLEQVLLTAALFTLLAGHSVAILHVAATAIGRKRWGLLLQLPTLPIYWLLVSLAGYRALYQLATQPFLWEKTSHGVSSRRRAVRPPRPRRRRRQRVLHS
jgi:glycosyltransferase XagB